MKNLFPTFIILLLSALLLSTSDVEAQLANKKVLTLGFAKKIAEAAENEAIKNNLNVVITILDDGGNLIYSERMDKAQLGSIDVAMQKAHTALFFKRPSKAYEDVVTGGKNIILGIHNIIPIEGGLPLMIDDQPAGSIGVSGGTPQQDGMVAKTGADYFNSLIK